MSSIAIVDLLKNLVEDEQETQILELLSQGISNDELIENYKDGFDEDAFKEKSNQLKNILFLKAKK